MAKPLVAIVGRPNVGKSMLFNKLVGRRLSIVEDTPGVTRDRLYAECEWRGRAFDIVDTGGIEPGTTTQILSFMRKQAEIAIQNATVIVFLCDIKGGSVHTVCSQLCAYENVKVFSGTNMNLVLDLLLSCPDTIETENREILLENAREGITLMTRDDLVEKKDEEF